MKGEPFIRQCNLCKRSYKVTAETMLLSCPYCRKNHWNAFKKLIHK